MSTYSEDNKIYIFHRLLLSPVDDVVAVEMDQPQDNLRSVELALGSCEPPRLHQMEQQVTPR